VPNRNGATRVARRNRVIQESLRELCGTRSRFVVLGCALSRFWNENPTSETVKNQAIAIAKIPILVVQLATKQEVEHYLGKFRNNRLQPSPISMLVTDRPNVG